MMMKSFLKPLNWLLKGMGVVVILMALLLLGMWILGIRMYSVLSGSMEPEIPTGTLIFTYPVKSEALEPGDIITFRIGDSLTATHRIISILEENDTLWFQTKGDANNRADGKLVHEADVLGYPMFLIPGAGYVVRYLQSKMSGFLIMTATISLLCLLLPDGIFKGKVKGKFLR